MRRLWVSIAKFNQFAMSIGVLNSVLLFDPLTDPLFVPNYGGRSIGKYYPARGLPVKINMQFNVYPDMYVNVYVCECVRVCMCMCVCVSVCVSVCMHV